MACEFTVADLPSEFSEVADADFQFWKGIAEAEVDFVAWGNAGLVACDGVKLLTCHYLAEAGFGSSSASSGEVTSERVGEVSVSYATSSASSKSHGATKYGKAFDALLRRVGGRRRTVPLGAQVVVQR
jgi:hypothetical protein